MVLFLKGKRKCIGYKEAELYGQRFASIDNTHVCSKNNSGKLWPRKKDNQRRLFPKYSCR